jgi:hypothetical protein
MTRVLLTTTSFQDTPGVHHELLAKAGFEITRERGPLPEARMLELAGQFDAYLCGDDAITRAVIVKSLPRLKVISKYGIGLDKIDVVAATDLKVPVLFTPGVNHVTVAEHTFALLLASVRHLVVEANYVTQGRWTRITGTELFGKTMGIAGLGRIGKEVAIRAKAFGMNVLGFDSYWDAEFAQKHGVSRIEAFDDLLRQSDIISLHTNLTPQTRHMINAGGHYPELRPRGARRARAARCSPQVQGEEALLRRGRAGRGAPASGLPARGAPERDHHPPHRLEDPRERPEAGQLRRRESHAVPCGPASHSPGQQILRARAASPGVLQAPR